MQHSEVRLIRPLDDGEKPQSLVQLGSKKSSLFPKQGYEPHGIYVMHTVTDMKRSDGASTGRTNTIYRYLVGLNTCTPYIWQVGV